MADNGYLALCLVHSCVGCKLNQTGDSICPSFKESKCDILAGKKEEFKNRLIIMYKNDIVDISLLKDVLFSMCGVCPIAEDCARQGNFSCIAAKDSILGMKSEGKTLAENSSNNNVL